jgi:formylglycine-generating enzyme required for sulfatase activity
MHWRSGVRVVAGVVGLAGLALLTWRLLRPATDPYATLGMAAIHAGHFVAGADDLSVVVHASTPGDMFPPGSLEPFALRPREVQVAGFAMDRTEVTVDAYAHCVEAGACSRAGADFRCSAGDRLSSRSALPITCVDYSQAERFCKWAGKRLPTELEWEYAARGEAGRRYPWGDAPVSARLMCSRQSEPCSVASRPAGATPEGIFDLAGNVWEWTRSDHCGREPAACHNRFKVVKGGPLTYQRDEDKQARGAFRQSAPVGQSDWDLGFRCVR